MAEVITVIVLIGMAICFYKGLEFVANLLRKLADKLRQISPDQRVKLDEEKLLQTELKKARKEQIKNQAIHQINEQPNTHGSQFGKVFEAWAGLAWLIFVIVILVKLVGYLDASEKRLDALMPKAEQIESP